MTVTTAELVVAVLVAAIGALTIAVVVAWALTRSGRLAIPNARSSHTQPTPAGPGVAVPIAVLLALAVSEQGISMAITLSAVLALIGFVDDLLDLPAINRVILQSALASAIAIAAGIPLWLVVPAAFATVAAINAVNFMDGINGITGLHGALFGIVLAVAALQVGREDWLLVGVTLTAACLGYLPHNFPAARSFPGDSLPYFLAVVFVIGIAVLALEEPVLILGLAALIPYAIDTATTVLRRARAGHSLIEAHRDHAYQRLARRATHAVSTCAFVTMSTVCAASLLVGLRFGLTVGLAVATVATLVSMAAITAIAQEAATR